MSSIRLSKMVSATRTALTLAKTAVTSRTEKREALVVKTPENLASVLINNFEATLFAIPKAAHAKSGSDSTAFLRSTQQLIANAGGYESRRNVLELFIRLVEIPSADAMTALCAFIELPGNEELKRAFEWNGMGSDALATISGYHNLSLFRKLPKPANRPRNAVVHSLGFEETKIAKEWGSLKSLLFDKGLRGDKKKWIRNKSRILARLDYLAFMKRPVNELLDSSRPLKKEPC
jgi:hypothetical protein